MSFFSLIHICVHVQYIPFDFSLAQLNYSLLFRKAKRHQRNRTHKETLDMSLYEYFTLSWAKLCRHSVSLHRVPTPVEPTSSPCLVHLRPALPYNHASSQDPWISTPAQEACRGALPPTITALPAPPAFPAPPNCFFERRVRSPRYDQRANSASIMLLRCLFNTGCVLSCSCSIVHCCVLCCWFCFSW